MSAGAQPVHEVLARAAAYVAAYEQALGSVIAEEAYRQDVSFPAATDPVDGRFTELRRSSVQRRTLSSEFLLLRTSGPHELWLGFRDILYVDGRAAPDRGRVRERLIRDPGLNDEEFKRLVNESARYNIGAVTRNVNVPTFALQVANATIQPRFSFEKREERRLAGIRAWGIAFAEHARPTLIRGSDAADMPAAGTIWVDPESGRIIQTELIMDEPQQFVRAQITVKYRPDNRLGIWVPSEMTERYRAGRSHSFAEQTIDCVATYSNFRRFQVDVKLHVPQVRE